MRSASSPSYSTTSTAYFKHFMDKDTLLIELEYCNGEIWLHLITWMWCICMKYTWDIKAVLLCVLIKCDTLYDGIMILAQLKYDCPNCNGLAVKVAIERDHYLFNFRSKSFFIKSTNRRGRGNTSLRRYESETQPDARVYCTYRHTMALPLF